MQEECLPGTCYASGLTSNVVRNNFIYERIPPNSEWKALMAMELLRARKDEIDVIGFTRNEIDDILTFACTQ